MAALTRGGGSRVPLQIAQTGRVRSHGTIALVSWANATAATAAACQYPTAHMRMLSLRATTAPWRLGLDADLLPSPGAAASVRLPACSSARRDPDADAQCW